MGITDRGGLVRLVADRGREVSGDTKELRPDQLNLENPIYDAYMRLPKGFVSELRVPELLRIADTLSTQDHVEYLNAAGWAYAEAGLVSDSVPGSTRMSWMNNAEALWSKALRLSDAEASEQASDYEDATSERLALNLAFLPLMKSIPAGGVSKRVLREVYGNILSIVESSAVRAELAVRDLEFDALGTHLGLMHEGNALLALLHLDDPRYIPLPSSARADSGYYHRNQSHDITVLNQHWGTIRKVIPLEIKASASRSDRMRYDALIVRGKMHLSVTGKHHPRYTLEAFSNVFNGRSNSEDTRIVDHATSSIKNLLVQYQQGENLGKRDSAFTKYYMTGKRAAELAQYTRARA